MPPHLKRWLRRGLLALLLLPLVLLAAVNALLSLGLLESMINPRPERLRVSWTRAWMVVPGVVEVRGLELRGQTRRRQWWLALERARVRVDLGALARRQFLASEVRGAGLEYRQRQRLDAPVAPAAEGEAAPEVVEAAGPDVFLPVIPGLSNPPAPAPDDARPRRRTPWEFHLQAVAVDEVREIWLDRYHYRGTGTGTLRGELRYAGRELALPALQLELPAGTMWLGEEAAGEGRVRVTARLEPMDPRQQPGAAFLRFASGELELEGRVANLALLHYYLHRVPWLRLDGSGQARAALRLERGRLLPGSRLDLDTGQIEAGYLGYRATGTGSIHGEVVAAAEGAARLEVQAQLDSFELGRGEQPYVRGHGFRLTLASPETDLLAEKPPLTAIVELPDSELPDLRCYNVYLPAAAGFAILGGSGRIRGRLELATGDAGGRGEVALTSTGVRLQVGELRLAGRLDLDSRLRSDDLLAERFLLERTELRITGATVTDAEGVVRSRGWWGRVTLSSGSVQLREPRRFAGDVRAELRDSAPLLDLFAGGTSLPSWSRSLLTVEDVTARTRVRATPGELDLEALELRGSDERMEMLGELRLRPGNRNALLFVRYGRLSAAAQVHNRWSEWRLRGSRAWYQEIRELQFAHGKR